MADRASTLTDGDKAVSPPDLSAYQLYIEGNYACGLEVARRIGDRKTEARCLVSLGRLALLRLDYDAAVHSFEVALTIFRGFDDNESRCFEAACIRGVGEVSLERGDYDAAEMAVEKTLPFYRSLDWSYGKNGEAECIATLGEIALGRGNYDVARSYFDEAQALFRAMGKNSGAAGCYLWGFAKLELARSDHKAAERCYEKALELYRRPNVWDQICDSSLGEANCLFFGLGKLALIDSDYDAAREYFENALAIYGRKGDGLGEANCSFAFGEIELARGSHDAARRYFEEALAVYRRIGNGLGETNCLGRIKLVQYYNISRKKSGNTCEVIIPFSYRFVERYSGYRPPSEPADTSLRGRMGGDLNTKVKNAKAENLARAKPRPKPRSYTHQLATYRALLEHVDLLNPDLSEDERKRLAKRLVQAYERVRARKRNFHDHSKQLLDAFSIMNKVKYQRRKKARQAKAAEAEIAEAGKLAM